MLKEWLVESPWPGIGLWLVVCLAARAISAFARRLYHGGANQHFTFEKVYDKGGGAKLSASWIRFGLTIVLLPGLLWLTWEAARREVAESEYPGLAREVYPFVLGAFVLRNTWLIVRGINSLVLYHYARRSHGIEGHTRYAYWLNLSRACVDLGGFGTIFFGAFLVTGSSFLLGGSVSCLSVAIIWWFVAEKERDQAEAPKLKGAEEPSS